MSVSRSGRPKFENRELQHQIMKLRRVDNWTNPIYLAREYACLAAVFGGAIGFAELRAGWGISWYWNIPVFLVAIALVGASASPGGPGPRGLALYIHAASLLE